MRLTRKLTQSDAMHQASPRNGDDRQRETRAASISRPTVDTMLSALIDSRLLKVTAWIGIALLAFAALVPIDFRPTTTLRPTIERFAAFGTVGLAFALAYPKRFWAIALFVVSTAIALEALQALAPSRHGRVVDALVKMAGGAAGVLLGRLVLSWVQWCERRKPRNEPFVCASACVRRKQDTP